MERSVQSVFHTVKGPHSTGAVTGPKGFIHHLGEERWTVGFPCFCCRTVTSSTSVNRKLGYWERRCATSPMRNTVAVSNTSMSPLNDEMSPRWSSSADLQCRPPAQTSATPGSPLDPDSDPFGRQNVPWPKSNLTKFCQISY